MLNSISAQYICKNTKNIQKCEFMNEFCLQGELDLTLFYKIEGCFDNLKSLMTLMTVTVNDRKTKKRPPPHGVEENGHSSFSTSSLHS